MYYLYGYIGQQHFTIMKQATICFLVRNGQVILAPKKKKVGAGFLNGYGGKLDTNETIRQCAQRETREESGGVLINLEKTELAAVIDFYAGDNPQFSCFIYIAREWEGNPKESNEMGPPEYFDLGSVPFDRMLPGDRLWFERIIKGERFKGTLKYSADFKEILSFETHPAEFSLED